MSRPKNMALELCALVVVALLANVGVAQGEIGATWKIKGAKLTAELLPTVQVTEVEGKDLTLISKVSGIKVEILCTGASLENAKLKLEGSISTESKVKFSGCLIKLNNTKQASCEPHNGLEKGIIVTNELKALLIQNESRWIVKAEPKTGETLATVTTSEECLVGEEIPVLGKLTLKDLELEKEATKHLLTDGGSSELWLVSKTEENKATVSGSLVSEMSGEHKGMPWSAVEITGSANWKVKGANVTSTLLPAIQVKELEGNDLSFLGSIAGVKLEALCTAASLIGAKLLTEGKSEGKIQFTGCILKLNGVEQKACRPTGPGQPAGTFTSAQIVGSLALHAGEGIIRFVPAGGGSFATLAYGEECGLFSENIPYGGVVVLKDNALKTEAAEHLFSESVLSELWWISNTPEHRLTIDGSAKATLTGVHLGLQWSGLPG